MDSLDHSLDDIDYVRRSLDLSDTEELIDILCVCMKNIIVSIKTLEARIENKGNPDEIVTRLEEMDNVGQLISVMKEIIEKYDQ